MQNVAVFIGFMYICWYLNLTYATAAIIALVHDVLVTLAFFVSLSLFFENPFTRFPDLGNEEGKILLPLGFHLKEP